MDNNRTMYSSVLPFVEVIYGPQQHLFSCSSFLMTMTTQKSVIGLQPPHQNPCRSPLTFFENLFEQTTENYNIV